MATLYIESSDIGLEMDHGALALRRNGELLQRIPLLQLERCVVGPGVQLKSGMIATLAASGVSLLVVNPRQDAYAVMAGSARGEAGRRLGQAAMALHAPTQDRWARHWVRLKALGQARLLKRESERSAAARAELLRASALIFAAAARLRAEPLTAESVRGVEGAASAAYFGALPQLFAPSLGFEGRNRRPPRDPVNACLSLIYTMLYGAAVEAALACGLDPDTGFLHEPAPGRASLACDLVEPLRPAADRIVVELFRSRTLRKEHFHTSDDGCLLGKAGRRAFYEAIEAAFGPMRTSLRRLARHVARAADAVYVDIRRAGGIVPCGRSM
jgi:CRISPR-associated protein Cas1